MSAIPPRCFALQRLGVEVWPIHTVQFSNHTGYGAWRGRAFDAGHDPRAGAGHRRARRARRNATACCRAIIGSAEIGAADPRCGGAGEARQSAGALLLRSGDRRCRTRRVRAAGHRRIHARRGRCRRPTSSRRTISSSIISPAATTRRLAEALAAVEAMRALGPRTVLVTSLRDRRDAGRRDRSAGLRRQRPLSAAHAEAADLGQRRGRRHRGAVLRALSAQRIGRRGAVARGFRGVRRAQAHRRGGRAGNPADRGAGRIGHARPGRLSASR